MRRGFSLLETTFSGVILMIGMMTLIAIGHNLATQLTVLRDSMGEPAIAESLVDAEIQAIEAPASHPPAAPLVAPIGLAATGSAGVQNVYEVKGSAATQIASGLWCYQISAYFDGQPLQAASPSVIFSGGSAVVPHAVYAPPVEVCRQ